MVGFGHARDTRHDLDVVHHINVFGCTRAVVNKAIPSLHCARNTFMIEGGPCSELLLTWDKGAEDYTFPDVRL